MSDIVAFLMARIAEDEMWAHEASMLDVVRGGSYAADGATWQWTDARGNPIQLDPLTMTYVDDDYDSGRILLMSVETYNTPSLGEMEQLAIQGAYEVTVPVGVHIARHDPARVLREVKAKRATVALHEREYVETINADGDERSGEVCTCCDEAFPCDTLKLMAAPDAQHADFNPAWAIAT